MIAGQTLSLFLSLAALGVSALSFLVAFRSYRIERARFSIERASQDVFIEAIDVPCLRQYGKYDVLICELSVSNRLPIEMILRDVGLRIFIRQSTLLGLFESDSVVSLGVNPTGWVSNDVHDARGIHVPLFDHESIHGFLLDADKRTPLQLHDMERIPPSPHTCIWWLIVVISHSKISQLDEQRLRLRKMHAYFQFHNGTTKRLGFRAGARGLLSDDLIAKYALNSIIPDIA